MHPAALLEGAGMRPPQQIFTKAQIVEIAPLLMAPRPPVEAVAPSDTGDKAPAPVAGAAAPAQGVDPLAGKVLKSSDAPQELRDDLANARRGGVPPAAPAGSRPSADSLRRNLDGATEPVVAELRSLPGLGGKELTR